MTKPKFVVAPPIRWKPTHYPGLASPTPAVTAVSRLAKPSKPAVEFPPRGKKQYVGAPPPMESRLEEIEAFTRAELETGDLAPVYPILKAISQARGYDEEQRLWLGLMWVAYHHLPSALTAIRLVGDRQTTVELVESQSAILNALPVGIERRRYSRRTASYLLGILDYAGEPAPRNMHRFFSWGLTDFVIPQRPYRNWRAFYERWKRFAGHRRRSTPFEMARTMRYFHGWEIAAPSIWLASDTTQYPSPALRYLYGTDTTSVVVLGRLAGMYRAYLMQTLVYDFEWEQIDLLLKKTMLFLRGRYYPGYALDEILSHMNRLDLLHPDDRADLLAAREACFDRAVLGEHNDWNGVRIERLPAWYGRATSGPRILRPVGSR